MFISPQKGTYVFYVSAVEFDKLYLKIDIVLNSVSKVRELGDSSAGFQTETNMIVLNVERGDSVWVRYSYGKGYYTESVPRTTFSGFLIQKFSYIYTRYNFEIYLVLNNSNLFQHDMQYNFHKNNKKCICYIFY